MAGDDDDYGDAFKKARLEHDQQRESPTEAKRLQAEADADAAAMTDVVLPQLQAAALKLEPLGGKVDIRQYGRTGKRLQPASVAFRVTDRQDQQDRPGYGKGHESRVYLIVPQGGNGNSHERQRFRRIRSSEATQERERGGRHPATR